MFISIHQTVILIPQHVFQSQSDHLWKEDKTNQIMKQFFFLFTKLPFILVELVYWHIMFIGDFNKLYKYLKGIESFWLFIRLSITLVYLYMSDNKPAFAYLYNFNKLLKSDQNSKDIDHICFFTVTLSNIG